ncbi:MAG TPA: flagellar basal body rod protein FlgB [Arenibaculum sp.]|nr:flagellar basal body rod protein FlgB [Arenibaculum sp.]
MDMNKLGLFRLITRKMDWLAQRQDVVAHNIANADTPGFRPGDLAPFSFRSALAGTGRLPPARTAAAHLPGTLRLDAAGREVKDRKPYEVAPDGNGVVLEEQLMKVSRTGVDYNMVTNLYRKHMGLIRTAIGRTQ